MNAFRIEKLATELDKLLANLHLTDAFTTSTSDIFLVFEAVCVRITFYKGEAYFQFPEVENLPKRNRLPVFRKAIGQKVIESLPHSYDRVFQIVFENGALVFFLYGRFSVVGWFGSSKSLEENFPVKVNCPNEIPSDNSRLTTLISAYNRDKDLIKNYPFLQGDDIDYLTNNRFLNVNNDVKESLLENVRKKHLAVNYYNVERNDYRAEVVPYRNEGASDGQKLSLTDALNEQSRYLLSKGQFNDLKQSQVAALKRTIKALDKKVISAEKRVEVLQAGGGNREKGDLIMANLYSIRAGEHTVTLQRFDGLGEVEIKLKDRLSPQANAERYYKKAKNEIRELEFARQHVKKLYHDLQDKQRELVRLEAMENVKELRKGAVSVTKETKRLPYRSTIIDGFEVRIGKGAHDNDELLSKYSHKNDTWFHAKDVSGSHVLIRNTSNSVLPVSVLEKVASIAAYYSKARSESLAAVIYTARKYVRKWKGAPPGKVRVERESVLLVEPKDIDSHL